MRAGRRPLPIELVQPPIHVLASDTVPLLKLFDEHVVVALDLLQIIIRQIAPLFLHAAPQLTPLAVQLVLVHFARSSQAP